MKVIREPDRVKGGLRINCVGTKTILDRRGEVIMKRGQPRTLPVNRDELAN